MLTNRSRICPSQPFAGPPAVALEGPKAVGKIATALRRAATAHRAAACALLLPGALAGCGSSSPTLNTVVIERAIASSILTERHIDATISCPSGVPRRKGFVFTCTARLTAGAYPVSVTEVDDDGHVRYGNSAPLSVLDTARVARAITISIRTQRRLAAHVVCPSDVLQQQGVVFTCTATVGSHDYPFTVTEIDGHGHVRYVGQR